MLLTESIYKYRQYAYFPPCYYTLQLKKRVIYIKSSSIFRIQRLYDKLISSILEKLQNKPTICYINFRVEKKKRKKLLRKRKSTTSNKDDASIKICYLRKIHRSFFFIKNIVNIVEDHLARHCVQIKNSRWLFFSLSSIFFFFFLRTSKINSTRRVRASPPLVFQR